MANWRSRRETVHFFGPRWVIFSVLALQNNERLSGLGVNWHIPSTCLGASGKWFSTGIYSINRASGAMAKLQNVRSFQVRTPICHIVPVSRAYGGGGAQFPQFQGSGREGIFVIFPRCWGISTPEKEASRPLQGEKQTARAAPLQNEIAPKRENNPCPQEPYIHRTILGEVIFGSLHKFHIIHCVSRNYTWKAIVSLGKRGVVNYIKKIVGEAVSVLCGRFGYFLFFSARGGKGESEAPGGGVFRFLFVENPRRGCLQNGRGQGGGGVCGKLGDLGGGLFSTVCKLGALQKARLRKVQFSGDFLGAFDFLRIACSLGIPQENL